MSIIEYDLAYLKVHRLCACKDYYSNRLHSYRICMVDAKTQCHKVFVSMVENNWCDGLWVEP